MELQKKYLPMQWHVPYLHTQSHTRKFNLNLVIWFVSSYKAMLAKSNILGTQLFILNIPQNTSDAYKCIKWWSQFASDAVTMHFKSVIWVKTRGFCYCKQFKHDSKAQLIHHLQAPKCMVKMLLRVVRYNSFQSWMNRAGINFTSRCYKQIQLCKAEIMPSDLMWQRHVQFITVNCKLFIRLSHRYDRHCFLESKLELYLFSLFSTYLLLFYSFPIVSSRPSMAIYLLACY